MRTRLSRIGRRYVPVRILVPVTHFSNIAVFTEVYV
jgi:hypothetical protein